MADSDPKQTTPLVPVIIGTAGHIDHGKSSLLLALTGTDPDRLAEEKRRGITIELGFVFFNERIAFIDVPGHEKFVKHMVAGAATIDFAMLIVAADDGVMPQTREHLDILNLLQVKGGLVVITKAEMVEEDLIELVTEDVRDTIQGTILEKAPILVVDSLSRRGIERLQTAILELAAEKPIRGGNNTFRMPIDRVFAMKGFGTVVTGSVLSGTAKAGDELVLLPQEKPVRIKGVQNQGRLVERVVAGQRAALNLAALSVSELERGQVLATPGWLKPSQLLDVKLSYLSSASKPLKHRQRLRIHLGTAEILGRVKLLETSQVQPGQDAYAQLLLETPCAVDRLDRFIIRQYSPETTIGGGIILDANPPASRRRKATIELALQRLDSGRLSEIARAEIDNRPFSTTEELASALSKQPEEVASALEELQHEAQVVSVSEGQKTWFCSSQHFQRIFAHLKSELEKFRQLNQLKPGMRKSELKSKLKRLVPPNLNAAFIDRSRDLGLLNEPIPDFLILPGLEVDLSPTQQKTLDELSTSLQSAGVNPPSNEQLAKDLSVAMKELRPLLTYLVDTGRAVCADGNIFFGLSAIESARVTLSSFFARQESVTVSEVREALGTTRKFILPLLAHLDTIGWTSRQGDLRYPGPNWPAP